MSFILEALTQSEEERHRGEVPNFATPPSSPPVEAPTRTARWPYILSIALLLNLTAALAWLAIVWKPGEGPAVSAPSATPGSANATEATDRPEPAIEEARADSNTGPPATSLVAVAEASAMKPTTATESRPEESGQIGVANSAPAAADLIPTHAEGKAEQPPDSAASVARATSISDDAQAADPPADQRIRATDNPVPRERVERRQEVRRALSGFLAGLPPPSAEKPVREDRAEEATTSPESAALERDLPPWVPGVRDLPEDAQALLPDIEFTVHVYAPDPAARVVRINGRMFGEGDAIDGKLRLVEITRTGVIMDADGNRFQMGVREKWRAR